MQALIKMWKTEIILSGRGICWCYRFRTQLAICRGVKHRFTLSSTNSTLSEIEAHVQLELIHGHSWK